MRCAPGRPKRSRRTLRRTRVPAEGGTPRSPARLHPRRGGPPQLHHRRARQRQGLQHQGRGHQRPRRDHHHHGRVGHRRALRTSGSASHGHSQGRLRGPHGQLARRRGQRPPRHRLHREALPHRHRQAGEPAHDLGHHPHGVVHRADRGRALPAHRDREHGLPHGQHRAHVEHRRAGAARRHEAAAAPGPDRPHRHRGEAAAALGGPARARRPHLRPRHGQAGQALPGEVPASPRPARSATSRGSSSRPSRAARASSPASAPARSSASPSSSDCCATWSTARCASPPTCASGPEYDPSLRTRNGVHYIFSKDRYHVSSQFRTNMFYAMFFDGGQAIHLLAVLQLADGYYGNSHGCVNVRDETSRAAALRPVVDRHAGLHLRVTTVDVPGPDVRGGPALARPARMTP